MRLELLVRRKGIDPTAETCLHALQELLGLDVADIEHGTLWRFEVDDGAAPVPLKQALVRAACRAGRFVNTNRDAHVWLDEAAGQPAGRPGHDAVDLLVCSGDGRDTVARAYFVAQIAAALHEVRRGTFYRLWTAAGDPAAAREFAVQVAVSRSRRQGLLLNPHTQSLEVLRVWSNPGAEEQRT